EDRVVERDGLLHIGDRDLAPDDDGLGLHGSLHWLRMAPCRTGLLTAFCQEGDRRAVLTGPRGRRISGTGGERCRTIIRQTNSRVTGARNTGLRGAVTTIMAASAGWAWPLRSISPSRWRRSAAGSSRAPSRPSPARAPTRRQRAFRASPVRPA